MVESIHWREGGTIHLGVGMRVDHLWVGHLWVGIPVDHLWVGIPIYHLGVGYSSTAIWGKRDMMGIIPWRRLNHANRWSSKGESLQNPILTWRI